MPFGSYQGDSKEALASAIRIMKESDAHSVKLEGGSEVVESVERILSAGIPVMGHLGLTPQSIYKFGTYTVRAKEEEEAAKLIEDSKLLEQAGCFSIVYEKIPAGLAAKASKILTIPTIGIGAGPDCDGRSAELRQRRAFRRFPQRGRVLLTSDAQPTSGLGVSPPPDIGAIRVLQPLVAVVKPFTTGVHVRIQWRRACRAWRAAPAWRTRRRPTALLLPLPPRRRPVAGTPWVDVLPIGGILERAFVL